MTPLSISLYSYCTKQLCKNTNIQVEFTSFSTITSSQFIFDHGIICQIISLRHFIEVNTANSYKRCPKTKNVQNIDRFSKSAMHLSLQYQVLHDTIFSILTRAIHNRIQSIALPAIGIGKLNVAAKRIARIMFDVVQSTTFLNDSLKDIRFVLHDKSTIAVSKYSVY